MNKFVNAVDRIVTSQLGISVHDLEDFAFCDYYDESFDADSCEFQNAVEECANDLLEQVQSSFIM
tara:strand:- start:1209 stop:1403 length:195 start_codon:yes stop_codon:yes gene_type:complete